MISSYRSLVQKKRSPPTHYPIGGPEIAFDTDNGTGFYAYAQNRHAISCVKSEISQVSNLQDEHTASFIQYVLCANGSQVQSYKIYSTHRPCCIFISSTLGSHGVLVWFGLYICPTKPEPICLGLGKKSRSGRNNEVAKLCVKC